MSKRAVITYAVKGREDYPKAMTRLIESLSDNFDGDIIAVCPTVNIEGDNLKLFKTPPAFTIDEVTYKCASHQELPYYFKSHMVKYAQSLGYTEILWLDSTIFVMKDLDPIFKSAKEHGFMSSHNKHQPLMWWIGDQALEGLSVPKESWEDESINQITACWMSFNLETQKGIDLLDEWWEFCKNKNIIHHDEQSSKRKCYKGHRHDQAIMSWLLHKRGIELMKYNSLFCYWQFKEDHTVISNRGVDEP